ncbi:hypothetical protein [Streptomyces laurentii]
MRTAITTVTAVPAVAAVSRARYDVILASSSVRCRLRGRHR